MKSLPLLLLSLVLVSGATAAELKLTIEGCPPGKSIRAGVYHTARGFAEDLNSGRAMRSLEAKADGQVLVLTFTGLTPGNYALAAFADSNGNGRLDRNVLGMPTEPFGFSRDARALFGPPDFEQAQIEVGAGVVTAIIHLQ